MCLFNFWKRLCLGKVFDNIYIDKKWKKNRFSGCVGCFIVLFLVLSVFEIEMVFFGMLDDLMVGCSMFNDN